jgi:TrmH RNA methyltransferase
LAEGAWVAVDGVDNPHNVGAIVRSAAFFGARGLLAGGVGPGDKVNTALLRVSEGGAEYLQMIGAGNLAESLKRVPRGWSVLGLETDATTPIEQAPRASAFVLVVGNEQTGLTPAVRQSCTGLYSIRGRGSIGSLNVSVAAGIALARLVPQG